MHHTVRAISTRIQYSPIVEKMSWICGRPDRAVPRSWPSFSGGEGVRTLGALQNVQPISRLCHGGWAHLSGSGFSAIGEPQGIEDGEILPNPNQSRANSGAQEIIMIAFWMRGNVTFGALLAQAAASKTSAHEGTEEAPRKLLHLLGRPPTRQIARPPSSLGWQADPAQLVRHSELVYSGVIISRR
ncbi:hypothetical protein BDK51DRAFT_35391 [Blyttiomyces helicus]|uniref:Uncharacterized protein n=1 Tax=Blyttiomyces helicus TaxID=388810 RepID=A0A4P9W638_9FUNG|nr:hypothetical protein BDK51DRAFT_35391 [Blyttiomyces helicus]|eukprot:RKO86378.1 hypothetical protein BDK51DRAFT_35391 [Blyttiomyces helicus]